MNKDNIKIPIDSIKNEEVSIIDEHISSILTTLSNFKTQITAVSLQVKMLEKIVKKDLKQHIKIEKNRKNSKKKLSGFAAPVVISNELSNFMGISTDTECARTDVTKFICNYIKENSLRNNDNKQIINPDDKLKNILGITDDDTLVTYFNIQRFMNHHFIKNKNNIKDSNI